MSDHIFLFSLIMHAGRRGTKFVLKAEAVDDVVAQWVYFFSGISPERQTRGGLTQRRVHDLEVAAGIINKRPVYAERFRGGPIGRYFVIRDFCLEN